MDLFHVYCVLGHASTFAYSYIYIYMNDNRNIQFALNHT